MAHSAYPTAAQVETFLSTAGVTLPSGWDTTSELEAAIAEWEQLTGFSPFIATTQTRVFNPPGFGPSNYWAMRGGQNVLKLDCPLISISAISVAGVAKTQGTDYYIGQPNDPRHYFIRFVRAVTGFPESISIAGSWGWGANVPDNAFQAIKKKAAAAVVDAAITKAISLGMSSMKEDDVAEDYGGLINAAAKLTPGDMIGSWNNDFKKTAMQYRRVDVYF
jgi:hypothetical protein